MCVVETLENSGKDENDLTDNLEICGNKNLEFLIVCKAFKAILGLVL